MLNARTRTAFTLIEVLIGVVLAGVVGAAALGVVLHWTRLAHSLGAVLSARHAVQDAAELLVRDARAAAPLPPGGAIYGLRTDQVEIRLLTGASVICAVDSDRRHVRVPPLVAVGHSLTSWVAAPAAGDTVLVYRSTANPARAHWDAYALARAPVRGAPCPIAASFTDPVTTAAAVALELATPLDDSVTPGAAIRIVRRTRYQHYRAGDGAWYLGVSDCLASRATPCTTVQPVAGPFTTSGVRLTGLDAAGAPVADSAASALDIDLYAVSRDVIHAPGWRAGPRADSLRVSVTFRN